MKENLLKNGHSKKHSASPQNNIENKAAIIPKTGPDAIVPPTLQYP